MAIELYSESFFFIEKVREQAYRWHEQVIPKLDF